MFALELQYSSTSTVDGTRSYHCFIPQGNGCHGSTIIIKLPYVIMYVCQNFGVPDIHGQIPKSMYQQWRIQRVFNAGILVWAPKLGAQIIEKQFRKNLINSNLRG